MKLYFDLGLLVFIHFSTWCAEHRDEAEKLISLETTEKLVDIGRKYLKELESRKELQNSKILSKDDQECINDEIREEIKLKKL